MGRFSDISFRRLVMQFSLPEVGFIRLPQVLTVIPVSKSSWWAGVKSGQFPQPVKLSPNCTAWRAEDIRNLIKVLSEQAHHENPV
jgi:predicted DNA-binding transcriptional regulator AlpA